MYKILLGLKPQNFFLFLSKIAFININFKWLNKKKPSRLQNRDGFFYDSKIEVKNPNRFNNGEKEVLSFLFKRSSL
ncbi:hypothetical protein C8P70_12270 [Myroides indicus]|uniref:Uncharacterized protein n=1 Tax=Myroides indicus TaxID=1323422 RepID=A0A4R7EZ36_9FLAO|nr:hypothetical protein C8P70_12270 [Myroides indicus]